MGRTRWSFVAADHNRMYLPLRTSVVALVVMSIGTRATPWWDIGILNESAANEDTATLLAVKSCGIAEAVAARINLIYGCGQCIRNGFMQRLERNVFACMAGLPFRSLDISMRHDAVEPVRRESSLSVFLIPDDNGTYVGQMIRQLNPRQRMKHTHRYIFIWRGALMPQLHELFRGVWRKHVLHAIALVGSKRVYTFEPFALEGFLVRRCLAENCFYDKLKNWNGHELRISMFPDFLRAQPLQNSTFAGYSSVDGMVAAAVVRQINATARYVFPRDNQMYGACRNGTFTGAVGDIIRGVTHIGFNARFVMGCMRPHIEHLYPYYRRIIYLVVPAAEMRPEYLIFLDAFDSKLWLLLLCNFLFAFLVFYLLHRCIRLQVDEKLASRRYERWFEVFVLLLKCQFGEPVAGFIRISSLRQFLIAWIFFSYVMNSVYFGKVESSFVRPTYKPDVETLAELKGLRLPIYGVVNLFEVVRNSLDISHWQHIEPYAVRLPLNYSGDQFHLQMARKRKRIAFVLRGETARDLIARTYDSAQNKPKFHIVSEYLRSMLRMYILTLGSPFIEKFQRCVSLLQESGLLDFWLNSDLRRRATYEHPQVQHDALDSPKQFASNLDSYMAENALKRVVLNLDILQGAFYLWSIGIGLSFIGFGLEWIYWTCRFIVLKRSSWSKSLQHKLYIDQSLDI